MLLCSANLATMHLAVTGATTDGDASDKIEKGILKMADAKAIGSLSLNSIIILSECKSPFIFSFQTLTPLITYTWQLHDELEISVARELMRAQPESTTSRLEIKSKSNCFSMNLLIVQTLARHSTRTARSVTIYLTIFFWHCRKIICRHFFTSSHCTSMAGNLR